MATSLPGEKEGLHPNRTGKTAVFWKPGRCQGDYLWDSSLRSSCAWEYLNPHYCRTCPPKIYPCNMPWLRSRGKWERKSSTVQRKLRSSISLAIFNPWLLISKLPGTFADVSASSGPSYVNIYPFSYCGPRCEGA